jgi:hypothetical protein
MTLEYSLIRVAVFGDDWNGRQDKGKNFIGKIEYKKSSNRFY